MSIPADTDGHLAAEAGITQGPEPMKRGGKATHEQLREHNLHLLLRAVYSGEADNRAALAQYTGLAKPTVSELVSELIRLGLLAEGGHGQSAASGGKRPRLLEFVPTARQVIGISVDSYQVTGVLTNLDGMLVARHYLDLDGGQRTPLDALQQVINALVAQLDAPLLCLGVGVPGLIEAEQGIVRASPHLDWRQLALGEILTRTYTVPAYIANSTELAAMAQYTYDTDESVRNLATILIDHNIEIGIALAGAVYHHGNDIGCLQMHALAGGSDSLENLLTAPAIKRRARELAALHPQSLLAGTRLSYLDIRVAEQHGDAAALQLYDELAGYLGRVCAWVIALLRPDHITVAGPVKTLGEPMLERVRARVQTLLPLDAAERVTYSLADSGSLSAIGAVANALQRELGIW